MPRIQHRLAAALAALLGAYACGGDGIVLPGDSVPADIVVVGGNGQAAPAGATLSQALRVQVTDVEGRPVANQRVSFSITDGGGQITPGTDDTDEDGVATASWTLGPGTGAQKARAQVSDAPDDLAVEFTATAVAGEGSTLVMVSGDGQSGAVGSALGGPLVVRVVDPLGNGVSGQTVSWSVVGGGLISPESSVTGSDGLASATRVLGPAAGTQTAVATAEGLAGSPVTFTHTAGASAPASFVRVSGDGQSAPAGFQLPDSLVVRLLDAGGNGVAGRTVTWVVAASAGAVNPVNSQTDADGYAVTRWTLGSTAGSYTLNAVFSGLPSLTFSATATADAPTAIGIFSGDNQTAPAGTALPAPLRVRVTDANGNGVENVSVTWSPVEGGSVSSTTTGTNAQGVAEVSRTLGPTPGPQTTTATVEGLAGSPITFNSTAVVGSPARLAFVSQPAGVLVGQTIPAFQVEVLDAQGNRVTTAGNQVTITSSVAGTLDGDNTRGAVGGVATFDDLSLDRAGTGYRLTARASNLTNAVSDAFDVAKGATAVAITGRSPSASVTGQSVTVSYEVDVVAPAAGGPGGSVTVSDGQGGSCTGGVNAGTGVGSCSIAFATAVTRTLTATYSGDANFEGASSAGVDHGVSKANTTVSVGQINGGDPSPAGTPVTVEYQVSVNSPGGGTPTGNVVITVSGGGETCTGSVAAGACELTFTTGGTRTVTASYAGDANYNGDTDSESHQVRTATSVAVTTSDPSTVFGESVTFTATVTPVSGGGTPGGNVQFRADGVALGGPVALSGGAASRSTSSLEVGSHVITAEYLGGGDFAGSTGTLSPDQQVTQAGTTTAIVGQEPTVSNPGQAYEVTVTVTAAPPGGGTPSGTVSISDGEGGSCEATLSGGSGSCSLASLTPGTKTLTATYGGDTRFTGSSGGASHEVNAPPVAAADAYTLPANIPSGVGADQGVLVNDTDAGTLTAQLASDATAGILGLFANGSFLYTPPLGFVGTVTFTYRAVDELGAESDPVTVTLTIAP